jgi:hypothetical protein
MVKRLLIPITFLYLTLAIPTQLDSNDFIYSNIPQIVSVAPSDGLDHIFNIDPLIYTIVIGLIIAIGALSTTLRVIWKRYVGVSEESSELHREKLRIALSTTETIKEALFLVQNIYDQVSKLNNSELDRRLVDLDIKNHLINITNDLDELKSELKSKLHER